ncbi:MAG: hypothetical protein SH817_08245 [Leptospira sp.]|nr:hypothetical protein [Leptospira sp.]
MLKEKLAKHNKTGNIYRVIGEAKNCTNGENDGQRMILYTFEDLIFVREKSEFLEKFTVIDG